MPVRNASSLAHALDDGEFNHQVDDEVFTSSGIHYRWLFLGQVSHATTRRVSTTILLLSVYDAWAPVIYAGATELFSHLAGASRRIFWVACNLKGPLIFTSSGAKPDRDDQFDVKFPKIKESISAPPSIRGTGPVVVWASREPAVPHEAEESSVFSERNPWG